MNDALGLLGSFFGDEALTPDQTNQRNQMLATMAMMGGMGMAQQSADPYGSPVSGLLGGSMQGLLGYQQQQQAQQQFLAQQQQQQQIMDMRQREFAIREAEARRAQEQYDARQGYLSQLPADQQALAVMAGDQYWSNLFSDPGETFEMVDSPFGRGGVGQKNSKTGKIINYQGPPTDMTPAAVREIETLQAKIAADPTSKNVPFWEARLKKLTESAPEALVKVFDAETGATHYIRRSQAEGMQAEPKSGFEVTTSPDGSVRVSTGSRGGKGAPTKDQSDAGGYAARMSDAHTIINELESVGSQLSGVIEGSDFFPNALKSADRQRYEQAKRNFVNAVLRRESGAVISDQEFANAEKQYFPVPGDSPEVIAQKRANRARAIQSLGQAAGPALPDDVRINLPDTITTQQYSTPDGQHSFSRAQIEEYAKSRGVSVEDVIGKLRANGSAPGDRSALRGGSSLAR